MEQEHITQFETPTGEQNMDMEKIITRTQRRLDIQQAALNATKEEIKILTGVAGLTKAVAHLQVKRDRQANNIDVTTQLLDHYTKKLATSQGKIK